uniref:Uncharacterized protein n=1 Tax=Cannabis sativa TaxID=3483 RepID=A0A803PRX1_CANSA
RQEIQEEGSPSHEVSDSAKEPQWTKTKAFTRTSSNKLIIDADKSPEAGNEVSTVGIDIFAAGTEVYAAVVIEEQPTGSAH